MASYGTVEYYQEEVEKARYRLELIKKGGSLSIYRMSKFFEESKFRGNIFNFNELRQICDQIESAENMVKFAEKELQEAIEKAKR